VSKPLTPGERMVWAAVYAKERDIRNPPRDLNYPKNVEALREWERGQAYHAIESACYAVQAMREAADHMKNGFGEDSDVYQMFVDMLGDGDGN
jgi:hypothetical protein